MNDEKSLNININKYIDYAKKLSQKELGDDFDSLVLLGIETAKFFPEYKMLEFKIFMKNQEEMYLNLFLKGDNIEGYDFITEK